MIVVTEHVSSDMHRVFRGVSDQHALLLNFRLVELSPYMNPRKDICFLSNVFMVTETVSRRIVQVTYHPDVPKPTVKLESQPQDMPKNLEEERTISNNSKVGVRNKAPTILDNAVPFLRNELSDIIESGCFDPGWCHTVRCLDVKTLL